MARRLVVGLGNRLRGDDAVGLEVARELDGLPGIEAVALEGEPVELIELWRDATDVVLVDAVAGAEPGRIHRHAGADAAGGWSARSPASSHALGLGQVLELASALGRLPPRLELFAIEGDSFATGAEPSAAVREAGRRVAAEIAARGGSVASTPVPSAAATDATAAPED